MKNKYIYIYICIPVCVCEINTQAWNTHIHRKQKYSYTAYAYSYTEIKNYRLYINSMYITTYKHTQKYWKICQWHTTLGSPVLALEGLFWSNLGSTISLTEELLCFIKISFYFNCWVSRMALESALESVGGVMGANDSLFTGSSI